MALSLGSRRAQLLDVEEELGEEGLAASVPREELEAFEFYDLVYRTLCAIMFNFVPASGHPGGAISSGRIVHGILYNLLRYDLSDPDNPAADIISYAAGHKALGLYAAWALRNEVARISAPSLLPKDEGQRLRLEDLLGFRRNPTCETPLFRKFNAKALDGHPKPNIPFVHLATGASGVGCGSSFGLAQAALDYYGADMAPKVHVVEGEGGMTPGRVSEALAMASASGLRNVVLHVDFNQSSIDSDRVCRDGDTPGDLVQWTPAELLYLHDWNVITVRDGIDFRQVFAAQRLLSRISNSQPTAIVYRTIKGWRYGIEGKRSHGAGHAFSSEGFYAALRESEEAFGVAFQRFSGEADPASVERAYWGYLQVIRQVMDAHRAEVDLLAGKLQAARERFRELGRRPRKDAPDVSILYDPSKVNPDKTPTDLEVTPGTRLALRRMLGRTLRYLNQKSRGAMLVASADLLESTGVLAAGEGFAEGYYHSESNPASRILSVGGICEDAMGAILSGVSTYGRHIGVGSSYAAFIASMQHVAARLHGIGNTALNHSTGEPFRPFIMVCGHAGYKTGEDGPTHADPQALQLLQEDFPPRICITLTPWDPQEIWPLLTTAIQARPAVVAIFVTRPTEQVMDRDALGLPPPAASTKGVYAMRLADPSKQRHGTLILQESGVTYAFVEEVLPRLEEEGMNLNVYYVASTELFDRLPLEEQDALFPWAHRRESMAITGFTLPTMYRWITSDMGRRHSLHAFTCGHYPGSGQASQVMKEAGLDGESQLRAIRRYVSEYTKASG